MDGVEYAKQTFSTPRTNGHLWERPQLRKGMSSKVERCDHSRGPVSCRGDANLVATPREGITIARPFIHPSTAAADAAGSRSMEAQRHCPPPRALLTAQRADTIVAAEKGRRFVGFRDQ